MKKSVQNVGCIMNNPEDDGTDEVELIGGEFKKATKVRLL